VTVVEVNALGVLVLHLTTACTGTSALGDGREVAAVTRHGIVGFRRRVSAYAGLQPALLAVCLPCPRLTLTIKVAA